MGSTKEIIDEEKINLILEQTKNPSKEKIAEILKKALQKKGLSLEEAGFLLNVKEEDTDLMDDIFYTASKIKNEIYGTRLVLFAPLYVSNLCINDCEYCGFHKRNPAERKKLSLEEIRQQVKILGDMGHKRLLLEFGEHPENSIGFVADVIKEIYATKSNSGKGNIRRVNVNIAATTIENYKKLKSAGIGTYQLFQETYHRKTYEMLHNGPKADYERQLFAYNRAFEAGIDDLGLGVLFGLYDCRFEALALISHAKYLERKFGVGPHTFSVPRFQPAETVDNDFFMKSEYAVSEEQLLKIIAVLRIAVPYTGMIISTRERPEIRKRAFEIGISQASAASQTSPGGYKRYKQGNEKSAQQFCIADHRKLDETIKSILEQGLLPSFCTACYRSGRTGKSFMDLAKPGDIKQLCLPNAILTFKEYLEDYASDEVRKIGIEVIENQMKHINSLKTREETFSRLLRIENGERDLYF